MRAVDDPSILIVLPFADYLCSQDESISRRLPPALRLLVDAAPRAARCAAAADGRRPVEWLPRGDALFERCAAVLSGSVARTLRVLLRANAEAASHVLPDGRMALHQVAPSGRPRGREPRSSPADRRTKDLEGDQHVEGNQLVERNSA